MKKFTIKFILICLPVFILLVLVNRFGDYANIFNSNYEKNIAKNILKGFNVTNVRNYNERLLQKIIISKLTVCPDVLVIGSSRQMLINSKFFKGKTFFNNSVSGATLQDISAILYMYEKKHFYPKKVILGLDPWTLNSSNGDTRWETLSEEYNNFYGISNNDVISNIDIEKWMQLVSLSYFKNSLNSLLFLDKELLVTNKKENSMLTKVFDGSICYDRKYRDASIKEIDKRVDDYLKDKIYNIENFNELDKKKVNELMYMLNFLLKKNIKVDIVLSPYHPKVYDFISKKDKYINVMKSEIFYKKLSFNSGITILGSFNPNENIQFTSSDFYDGMHLNENGLNKIFEKYSK